MEWAQYLKNKYYAKRTYRLQTKCSQKQGYFARSKGWCVWQYGLWSFQAGYTKLERVLPKKSTYPKETIEF